ncbi:MAG: MerR family transcriptional regulator [Promicromonosporaceae bacterium]|nr:MerR family transcriptional regulator [Promicromonosporaceae bacterium]
MTTSGAIGAKAIGPVAPMTAAHVANQLGITVNSLRGWARSYGLGPTITVGTGRHKYGPDDVHRLQVMRHLTLAGLEPAQAAQIAVEVAAHPETAELEAVSPQSQAHLRLLPPVEVSDVERAVDKAITAALASSFAKTVSALKASGLFLDDDGEFDPIKWWLELALPALAGVAERVVLNPPGNAPEAVVTAAVLRVMTEILNEHDHWIRGDGGLPSSHPARFQSLVLIFAPPSDLIALQAHALALAIVVGGAAARIVSGPITPAKVEEVIELTRPAVVVVEGSENDGLLAQLALQWPNLPLVAARDAPAPDADFAALVAQVRHVID